VLLRQVQTKRDGRHTFLLYITNQMRKSDRHQAVIINSPRDHHSPSTVNTPAPKTPSLPPNPYHGTHGRFIQKQSFVLNPVINPTTKSAIDGIGCPIRPSRRPRACMAPWRLARTRAPGRRAAGTSDLAVSRASLGPT